jgi:hypothetical protein
MTPVEGIAKLGFRRWYERQLIEGHAWFVTCVLSLLAIFAVLEEISFRGPLAKVLGYGALAFLAGVLAIYALQKYRLIMAEAERYGEHSTCARCGAYARFTLLSGATVQCRKCANRWSLTD